MPSITNITLKDSANADVLFTAITGGNEANFAQWLNKVGATPMSFPLILARGGQNGPKTARKGEIRIKVPYVAVSPETGLPTLVSTYDVSIVATVPDSFPESMRDTAAGFVGQLLSHVIPKAVIRDGYPVT